MPEQKKWSDRSLSRQIYYLVESVAAIPLLMEVISKPSLGTILETTILTAVTINKGPLMKLTGFMTIIAPKILDIHTFNGTVSDVGLGILAIGFVWDFISRGHYNLTH